MTVPIQSVLAPNPSLFTGQGTNTYLVGAPDVVLIDPGPDDPVHLDAILAAARAQTGTIRRILLTHGHADHCAGAARLKERTGAPILGGAGLEGMDVTLEDGDVVEAQRDASLRALHTPGHAREHFCFLLEPDRILFSGDLIAGAGTIVIAPPEGNMSDYLGSLHRVQALGVRLVLPGHGPPVEEAPALIQYYLDHRYAREQMILAAWRDGARTVPEIVARVYADVDPTRHPIAASSVRAHLEKLEQEGVICGVTGEENGAARFGVRGSVVL